MKRLILLLILQLFTLSISSQMITLTGKVSDSNGTGINAAVVRISNSLLSAVTDKSGNFELQLMRRSSYNLIIRHLSYDSRTLVVKDSGLDTIQTLITLKEKTNLLDSISVSAVLKPETLVGKPAYSVYDFDFLEENYLLLTAEGELNHATLRLSDPGGRILLEWSVPREAGPALRLHHDFEGYTELICRDSIFRIEVYNQQFLISTVRKKDFHQFLEAVSDSANHRYYWTNRSEYYPAMDYYWLKQNDSISELLKQISNSDLLKLYNMEYYYLPARARLEADRIAKDYKTDVHVVAALMSGFTRSMFFEPPYAPLFVLNDTICIFNHHNDQLYHYDRDSHLIDSVNISYHHPKNWREGKKKMFVDEEENRIYAYFSKDGHHYLKQISQRSGTELMTYKLKNHSATNIRVRNGYVYYVYRPFGSTQQKFLYRELIRN